jgi:hypothetical protein
LRLRPSSLMSAEFDFFAVDDGGMLGAAQKG